MSEQEPLPERPAQPDAAQPAAEGEAAEKGPSKAQLKKLEKERQKAEKKRLQQEKEAAAKAQADANDVSKGKYGETPIVGSADYKPFSQNYISVGELANVSDGTSVLVRARVANARSQSAKLAFLNFRDQQHTIQAVVAASDAISRQFVKFAANVPTESIVDVVGLIKNAPEPVKSATVSNVELHIQELFIISKVSIDLPIQVVDAERRVPAEGVAEATAEDGRPAVALPTRLDNRVIDLRSTLNFAIFQIRSGVKKMFREYLDKLDFEEIDSPKLLGAPSEGGANVFEVKYFEGKAYLAQSPQFYKQMCVVGDFPRVYEIAPVFRAENSNTSRHLTEYTSLDMEMSFEKDYHEVIYVLRDLMFYILNGLQTRYREQTSRVRKEYGGDEFLLPDSASKIPIVTFTEGIEMLKAAGVSVSGDEDINSQDEKHLGNLIREKYGTDFYVLKEYPLAARAFYSMPSSKDPKFSHSYDFMLRGQEVLSGAQRIHEPNLLRERMRAVGLDPDNAGLKDYVKAFEFAAVPHAGGAFGLERIVSNWLNLGNVRLASMFPRDPGRLFP